MSFRENRIQKAVMEEEKIFKSTTAFLCLKGDLYETDLSSLRRLSASRPDHPR